MTDADEERAREIVYALTREIVPGHVSDLGALREAIVSALRSTRTAALEEAEQIAGRHSAQLPHDSDLTRGYAEGRRAAAAAIRSMRKGE